MYVRGTDKEGTSRINKPAFPLEWMQVYTTQHYILAQAMQASSCPSGLCRQQDTVPNALLGYEYILPHLSHQPLMTETQGSIKMLDMNSHSYSCSF
jgi:hypothetical protein